MMHTILKYLPYVLLFAVATMIVYGWGLWRTMRQGSDLANMLSSKGISKVKKTLKKNGRKNGKMPRCLKHRTSQTRRNSTD